MERRTAVRYAWLIRATLTAVLGGAAFAQGHDTVVLVVGAKSDVTALSSVEVRKLFMGLTVMSGGRALHALRNDSDPRLDQIFLQNIVSMSDATYERQVLGLALRQGREPPPTVHSEKALLRVLAYDPAAVSFAWGADVAGNADVKVIRVLWHE